LPVGGKMFFSMERTGVAKIVFAGKNSFFAGRNAAEIVFAT